jgi:ABC-type arginine transport system ATPase subunit
MTDRSHKIPQGIAFAGCKIANKGENIMLKTLKKAFSRAGKSKTQRVLELLETGKSVSWKTLRTRFDLTSPRAMVDKLRAEGNMIYINKTAQGTFYRLGTPSKAIIAAGIKKLYGTQYAYKNA